MSFDLESIWRAVELHGAVARVVIVEVRGSTPRETGTSMLVWSGGQSGTIGGGTLEFEAAARARQVLERGADQLDRVPLGPALGQCCGGALVLLTERYDAKRLENIIEGPYARSLPGAQDRDPPMEVSRLLSRARAEGIPPDPQQVSDWFVEPLSTPRRSLWIYGAGHVGRALVSTLAPLPDFAITWVDTSADRFPDEIQEGVTVAPASNPATLAAHAPETAEHLVLTYSHALDLELCHQILLRPFKFCGLIGSATKWARFRSRLSQLGHSPEQISRITCPIGDPALGKHPQAIALGVGAELLRPTLATQSMKGTGS